MTSRSLEFINFPGPWRTLPLWSVAPRIKEINNPSLPLLSVFLDAGVVPRDSRSDNHNQPGEDLARYLSVEPGDLVFNKLRTWQGGLGVSQYRGIVSPAYYVCRPTPVVNPQFFHYLLRSTTYLTELKRRSKWMPPSQFDIPWENLRDLPITLPEHPEQRRIADFLDAETARIDRLILLRRSMSARLTERENALRDNLIERLAESEGCSPLRRLVTTIEQGSSPQCHSMPRQEESEWGVLKLSSVKRGIFFPGENKMLPEGEEVAALKEVRPGDLLVTRANTPTLVGDAAVVAEPCHHLLLPDLIYRVNLTPDIEPIFVAQVLLGDRIRSLIESIARGSSQSMVKLRGEDIKSLPIPNASPSRQRSFAREMGENSAPIEGLRSKLARQVDLLMERRQALITAAVTGQFDVSTASGRGVTE